MIFFRSKSEKEREREIREEEQRKASERLMNELRRHREEKVELVKQHERDLIIARAEITREKNEEIKMLQNRLEEKIRTHDKFKSEMSAMQILVSEMSAIGSGMENMMVGITRRFHNAKDRMEIIGYSFNRKEQKYKKGLER